jgi:type IV secretory pathway TraG/TraD family ATPase VirD4
MKQKWGRAGYAGSWPSDKPIWTIGAVIVAVIAGAIIGRATHAWSWTPLQRCYADVYEATDVAGGSARNGTYSVLVILTRTGNRLALDEDVVERGEYSFAITSHAAKAGGVKLEWQQRQYGNAWLHQWLRHWIYKDQSLVDLDKPGLFGGLAIFAASLFVAIPKDIARARRRKNGRRLKGPELVTPAKFNRRNRSDGITFVQQPSFSEKLTGRRTFIGIPKAIESSHILIMGDTGTGKSVLTRRILLEVERRGETAIVYDPALEYTPQFLNPSRGDFVLNPLDQRMPYWTPGNELRHEAEALTLATSLFPDRFNENPFFVEGPRKIFAHLLTFHPTPEELVWWMSHPQEIDRRVEGTEFAAMIDPQSPPQRSGVLGSLNMVADALKLLPTEKETTQVWSALEWSKERRGWLFLTSTPETRKRLLPLISLWLDTLVLRLMNQGQASPRPVWFVLDELASLQQLPQLHTAVTENRKSNNPIVLGFQGRSQLETRYGHESETMLSQPATKIFLRTSEPRAAKWISETIGEVEIERLRESRTTHPQRRRAKSYNLDRQVEPLVMPSEITGLEPLHGYLKTGNLVVPMSFPYIQLPEKQPKFVERKTTPEPRTAAKALTNAGKARDDGAGLKVLPQEVKQTHDKQLKQTVQGQQRFFE